MTPNQRKKVESWMIEREIGENFIDAGEVFAAAEFGLGLASEEYEELSTRLADYGQQIRESVLCGRDKAAFHQVRAERDALAARVKELEADEFYKEPTKEELQHRVHMLTLDVQLFANKVGQLTQENEHLHKCLKARYKEGYSEAVHDFGIWNDGVQTIGCLDTPIKEVLRRKFPDETRD